MTPLDLMVILLGAFGGLMIAVLIIAFWSPR